MNIKQEAGWFKAARCPSNANLAEEQFEPLERLTEDILRVADKEKPEFKIITGQIRELPKIESAWTEPDGFDWDNQDPPWTNDFEAYLLVSWKVQKGENQYGYTMKVRAGKLSADEIVQWLQEHYEHSMSSLELD